MRGLVQESAIGGRFSQCQKGLKRGSVTCKNRDFGPVLARFLAECQKGSKWSASGGRPRRNRAPEIFRFGYAKAVNDKRVPDRVGSEVFVLQKLRLRVIFGRCSANMGYQNGKCLSLEDPGHVLVV